MPPPNAPMVPHQYGKHQQVPFAPDGRTMPEYGSSQLTSRPHVNMTMPGSELFFPPASAYAQYPPGISQPQPPNALENQLRNMILSNSPAPGQQNLSPQNTARLPAQNPAPSPQGGPRRPNQAQRKQQAQQLQVPVGYTPMAASTMNTRSQQMPNHGPRLSHGAHLANQYASISANEYSRQSQQYNAVPPPQQLFDPTAGVGRGNMRRGQLNVPQGASSQAQLDYIDQLASVKIPEIQISPEEYAEKQILRERMENACRLAILDLDAQSEGVELKPFGSLSIGFATRESDMDLVLVSPKSKPDLSSSESDVPRLIEKMLLDMGYGARLLTQTRVPIIKFCEKPGPELAAHLRLTRLQWEKERDSHARRVIIDSTREAAKKSSVDLNIALSQFDTEHTQELDLSTLPQSPPISITTTSKSGEVLDSAAASSQKSPEVPDALNASTPKTGSASTEGKTEKEKTPPRVVVKIEHDTSWLGTMSEYELIGLYKIALKEGHCEPHQKSIITLCLESLETPETATDLYTISRGKALETLRNLPDVIKKCRVPGREDLDFPKSGVGIQCDINFSNQLALHNSLLLKCYSLCDPRVRQMVLFVKAWTKRRKINSPYHGTLNSYGYVLMVLHFLMNVARPAVIPNLQLAPEMIQNDTMSASEVSFDGHNIQFFRNEAVIQQMARDGIITQNRESLGSLLRGFFQFYSNPPYGTFSWKENVLSLRTKGGILTKVGKGWLGARTEMVDLAGPGAAQKKVNHHYVVAIEDPFETDHNVARTVFFNGVVAIRDEFRRATDLITNAGIDPRNGPQDFFAEGKKNENLQQRRFSSRKDTGQKKETGPGRPASPGGTSAPGKNIVTKKANASSQNSIPYTDTAARITTAKAPGKSMMAGEKTGSGKETEPGNDAASREKGAPARRPALANDSGQRRRNAPIRGIMANMALAPQNGLARKGDAIEKGTTPRKEITEY